MLKTRNVPTVIKIDVEHNLSFITPITKVVLDGNFNHCMFDNSAVWKT
jgi:hypothetical protein